MSTPKTNAPPSRWALAEARRVYGGGDGCECRRWREAGFDTTSCSVCDLARALDRAAERERRACERAVRAVWRMKTHGCSDEWRGAQACVDAIVARKRGGRRA